MKASGAKDAPRYAVVWAAAAAVSLCWLAVLSVTWRTAPDLGHSWAVPMLAAYLWWERWGERPVAMPRETLGGWWIAAAILLGALELPLRLLLTPFPLWPMLLVAYTGLLVVAVGIGAWLFAGRAGVRWTLSPLILAISALPVPSIVESSLIVPLRRGMAGLVAEISNTLGQPALASGTSIQLANSWVGVDEACGGIRSLQACVMIALFFGEWYRFAWLRRAILVAAALMAALAGNFVRVLFLALRAQRGAGAVADAHDNAGWLAMIFSLAATGWIAWHWSGYRWPAQSAPRSARPVRNLAWKWAAVFAAVITINEVATFTWYRTGEAKRSAIPQWSAKLPAQLRTFQAQPLSEAAREMLRPDLFVAGSWRVAPGAEVSAYYIEWRRGQVARSVPFLHNPTVCLPLAGCELVGALPSLTITTGQTQIPFFVYRFRRARESFLVAFTIWDTAEGHPLTQSASTSWLHWWRLQWREVENARKDMPAQLLTVAVSDDAESTERLARVISGLVADQRSPLVER